MTRDTRTSSQSGGEALQKIVAGLARNCANLHPETAAYDDGWTDALVAVLAALSAAQPSGTAADIPATLKRGEVVVPEGIDFARERLSKMADHGRIDAAYADFAHPSVTMIADVRKMLMHYTPRPAAARPDVVEAARALVAKLDAIHDDGRYKSVWTINQMHTGPYTGPTYTDELTSLRAALDQRTDREGGK